MTPDAVGERPIANRDVLPSLGYLAAFDRKVASFVALDGYRARDHHAALHDRPGFGAEVTSPIDAIRSTTVGRTAGKMRGARNGRTPACRTTPAHVTIKLSPALRSLRTKALVRTLERTFAVGCERSTFRLVHYSLQRNHAHFIVEARDREALGRGMMAIGSRLALAVNRVTGRRKGRVVADRYHSRLLETPREVQRALRYVLLNARKHAAGTMRRAARVDDVLDPASSARWFDGWNSGLTPKARNAPPGLMQRPAVARARTWLLRIGWRRHGLLDPAVVPA